MHHKTTSTHLSSLTHCCAHCKVKFKVERRLCPLLLRSKSWVRATWMKRKERRRARLKHSPTAMSTSPWAIRSSSEHRQSRRLPTLSGYVVQLQYYPTQFLFCVGVLNIYMCLCNLDISPHLISRTKNSASKWWTTHCCRTRLWSSRWSTRTCIPRSWLEWYILIWTRWSCGQHMPGDRIIHRKI